MSHPAYLESKDKGDHSMPGKRRAEEDVYSVALQDSCDTVRAKLPEPQNPASKSRPPTPRLTSESLPAGLKVDEATRNRKRQYHTTVFHSSGSERWPVRSIKDSSGAPKSHSDVRLDRNRGLPTGRESYGNGAAVVVGERERRSHGEGRQVFGIGRKCRGTRDA